MKLSPEPTVHPTAQVVNSTLGAWTEVGAQSSLLNSTFGDYTYCTARCDFANVEIGKFSNIATGVRVGATDHPLNRASLHHFMYRSADYWEDAEHDQAWFDKRAARRAYVGHDTWLGHHAQIKPEVTVGHGAVVASGAVVTKDVAPYTIVAGVPAKPVRVRLEPDLAERMIALAWWDWDHTAIRAALDDFRHMPVLAFLEKYER